MSEEKKLPFHECYILIEVDDDGEEHATFHASPAARDKATLEAIWFGGPDPSHKEEAEHYLQELREKGSLSFEGDPPLRWRTLSDYIKEHTALLQEERARAFEEAAKEVDSWLDLLEIDHRDIIAKGQYKDPQEAGREYRNMCNLLSTVRACILKKAAAISAPGEEGENGA